MITPHKQERLAHEWHYELPMDARQINDAIMQVELELDGCSWDDRYHVRSDGDSLIFYWNE